MLDDVEIIDGFTAGLIDELHRRFNAGQEQPPRSGRYRFLPPMT